MRGTQRVHVRARLMYMSDLIWSLSMTLHGTKLNVECSVFKELLYTIFYHCIYSTSRQDILINKFWSVFIYRL